VLRRKFDSRRRYGLSRSYHRFTQRRESERVDRDVTHIVRCELRDESPRHDVPILETLNDARDRACIEKGLTLLYSDKDFDPFVEHLGLRTALPGI
jgi:hypothetical protein